MNAATTERTIIKASRESVWRILSDLELMELWNPKCRSCRPKSPGEVCAGKEAEATFQMRGRESRVQILVGECLPQERLSLKHYGGGLALRTGHVVETFQLKDTGEVTEVVHTVDFTQAGLPAWVRILIWMGNVLGIKSGAGPLDGLRRLAEQPPTASHAAQ